MVAGSDCWVQGIVQGLLKRVVEGGMMVDGACGFSEVILEFGALGLGMVDIAEDADCDRREVLRGEGAWGG